MAQGEHLNGGSVGVCEWISATTSLIEQKGNLIPGRCRVVWGLAPEPELLKGQYTE